MKIELKNIKTVDRLSEETICFTADLYVDGILTAYVSNRGHGGAHSILALDGQKTRLEAAYLHCKSLPPVQFQGYVLESDIEMVISDLVEDHFVRTHNDRQLKRLLKNSIVALENNRLQSFKLREKRALTPQDIAHFKNKAPNAIILNEMPYSEALIVFSATIKAAA